VVKELSIAPSVTVAGAWRVRLCFLVLGRMQLSAATLCIRGSQKERFRRIARENTRNGKLTNGNNCFWVDSNWPPLEASIGGALAKRKVGNTDGVLTSQGRKCSPEKTSVRGCVAGLTERGLRGFLFILGTNADRRDAWNLCPNEHGDDKQPWGSSAA